MKTGQVHPGRRAGIFSQRHAKLLVSCVLFCAILFRATTAGAIDASIVVDANTDTVISQQNADRLLHPASMSKLMTLYLTFEALEAGRITLQRMLPVSQHAESMSPTKLGLIAGQRISVEDAILSLITQSANDAAVVLAEGLGGSEDRFGQLMTRKAHQLGMVNTNFRNSNGLPDPAQISTARDMAILCRALIRHFPQYYHYFSVREFTYNGNVYANHNHLMSRYEGMDGLKTGLTNASGFNLAASAVRGGRRLIGVVFGGTSAVQRDDYMAAMLDQGFQKVGGVAMTTALPPPVPRHKPSEGAPAAEPAPQPQVAAALPPTPVPLAPTSVPLAPTPIPLTPTPAPLVPTAGPLAPTPVPEQTESVAASSVTTEAPAPAAPVLPGTRVNASRPTTIGELAAATGQGDIVGPGDISPAPRSRGSTTRLAMATTSRPVTARGGPAKGAPRPTQASWSIQVGAYATRKATEDAIRVAVERAPQFLKHATVVVAALPHHHGTLYRARLTGLEAGEARKACKLLSHCLTVPPGAS